MKTTLLALAALSTVPLSAQCSSGPSTATPPPIPRWNPTDIVAPRPAGPATPGPATPSTPGPSSPSRPATPGAGGPTTPRGPTTGPTTPRGMPIDFTRAEGTQQLLEIDWSVPLPPAVAQPLSWERAVEALRGEDLRPLLVRRQPHAIEAEGAERVAGLLRDERVALISRWFHCVDLPDASRHPEHPFSGLYDPSAPPLLFVVDADGTDAIGFDGLEPRSEILAALEAALKRNYRRDVDHALQNLERVLADYDRLFSQEKDLLLQRDRALEKHGPESSQYRGIDRKLTRIREELAKVKAREEMVSDLGLVPNVETDKR